MPVAQSGAVPGGRVLMLAHHFPPAGGSGANRALAFARYLPAFGWRPIVITPGAPWAANRDDALLAEVPRELRVVRTRSWEPRPRAADPSSRASLDRHTGVIGPSHGAIGPSLGTIGPSLGTIGPSLGTIGPSLGTIGPSHGTIGPSRGESGPSHAGIGASHERHWTVTGLRSHLGHARRFPDAHVGWVPFALAAARRERFDVAYSSSGPFTSHLVGLLLKKTTGRPWVAELRDGWYRWNRAIFPDYPVWRDALERRLEAAAIRGADRVVLVTERMACAFADQYADLPADHFRVVSNGFDPSQFAHDETTASEHAGWQLLHAGALYYGRSLLDLLQAVRQVMDVDADFARDFRLRLIGTLDAAARGEVERGGLGARVEVLDQTSHAEAIAAMRVADALLLVANTTPGAEATVPGKLFEYLAVGRPILAVAPRESSTADVLRQTGGGWLTVAGDVNDIACGLRRAYAAREHPPRPSGVGRFDRRFLAGDLATVLDEAVTGAARRF